MPSTSHSRFSAAVLVMRLLSFLPLGLVLALAAIIGRIMVLLPMSWVGPYRNCVINLMLAYPEKPPEEIRRLARNAMIETARTIAEMSHVWCRSREEALARVSDESSMQALQKALDDKKPVVIVAMHMSNWEWVGQVLSTYCDPVILYQPGKDKALEELVLKSRVRGKAKLFPADRSGIKACMSELAAGGVVAILADHVPAGKGNPMVPFFGVPASTSGLIPKLVRKHQARAFYLSNVRDDHGCHHVYLDQASEKLGCSDTEEALLTQNQGIERAVNRCIEQYNWPYKRYRVGPQGRRRIYKRENTGKIKKLLREGGDYRKVLLD